MPKDARYRRLNSISLKLAEELGLSGEVLLEQIPGGRNNRVYRMTAGGRRFLLKSYFVHADDPRDRLNHEYSFLRYAWDKGIRCIPQPLAADNKQQVALYEFIDGVKLTGSDLSADFVKQAVNFVRELNQARHSEAALNLPVASGACFSIGEHLDGVARRLKRLGEIEPCDSVNKNACNFIRRELVPRWMNIKNGILAKLENSGGNLDRVIDDRERCLSPSDFGFHNALREQSGKLRFIDFEYAGWDDPAKLICDFFCQPEISVAREFMVPFRNELARLFDKKEELKERIVILFPVYRISWCSIMLNEFIPEGYARRSYAAKGLGIHQKEQQLQRAKTYLSETWNCCV